MAEEAVNATPAPATPVTPNVTNKEAIQEQIVKTKVKIFDLLVEMDRATKFLEDKNKIKEGLIAELQELDRKLKAA